MGEIANKLEAERDFNERRVFVIENSDAITNILDEIAWRKGIRSLMKYHVVTMFKNADYDIDPELADMMAHMVRALHPEDPDENAKPSEYDDYTY